MGLPTSCWTRRAPLLTCATTLVRPVLIERTADGLFVCAGCDRKYTDCTSFQGHVTQAKYCPLQSLWPIEPLPAGWTFHPMFAAAEVDHRKRSTTPALGPPGKRVKLEQGGEQDARTVPHERLLDGPPSSAAPGPSASPISPTIDDYLRSVSTLPAIPPDLSPQGVIRAVLTPAPASIVGAAVDPPVVRQPSPAATVPFPLRASSPTRAHSPTRPLAAPAASPAPSSAARTLEVSPSDPVAGPSSIGSLSEDATVAQVPVWPDANGAVVVDGASASNEASVDETTGTAALATPGAQTSWFSLRSWL